MTRSGCATFCGLLLMAGCAGGPAEVTGTVRHQGRALSSGTVVLLGADGKEYFSVIGTDGRYRIVGAPPGRARFAVKSHGRVPAGFLRPGERQEVPAIPARYQKPETSGLEAEVRGRVFRHDIDLAPPGPQ